MRKVFEHNGYEEPYDNEHVYTTAQLSDYLNTVLYSYCEKEESEAVAQYLIKFST